MSYYIASFSGGKDSTAMVLWLLEQGWPLDEVVFYDTGMEFQAVYGIRDKIAALLKTKNIKFTELCPEVPFLYEMFEKPRKEKDGSIKYGYGWCGGPCRWHTERKLRLLNRYTKQKEATVYVGIAIDEPLRLERLASNKTSPLAVAGMTEADCLQYCHDRGYYWYENGIELYSILDRVSCWCCSNKNLTELRNMWMFLPEYWQRLKDLQSKIPRPMKKYKNKKYGEYGNIFDLEKVFESEEMK